MNLQNCLVNKGYCLEVFEVLQCDMKLLFRETKNLIDKFQYCQVLSLDLPDKSEYRFLYKCLHE